MASHSDGEVWGLDVTNFPMVATSADDNKAIIWDTAARKKAKAIHITNRAEGKGRAQQNGASTLSDFPASQCSRAISCDANGNCTVAMNDGKVIFNVGTGDEVTKQVGKEWIEVLEKSPDGRYLAVGSHDNNIYIFEGTELKHTLKGHNSYIVALDWSQDSTYMRSNCGAYEILYWTISDDGCAQDKNGKSNSTSIEFASCHTKFGWHVDGIYPPGTDGTHVNGVNGSHDGMLIVTGDDFGLVNVFRNPVRKGHLPYSVRGHSEHVVRVAFSPTDDYILSIGGYDQTMMQWKRC